MRGKRFCLFVMAFVAMALCFMLTGYSARGAFAEEPPKEEVRLEAIYDRPADVAEQEAGPDVRDMATDYEVMRV